VADISKLSLKALRDQINAGTREVTFATDDGGFTQMVYIPKFRVPAGMWEAGAFPPQDLLLGGFFVDKYQCSHKAATSAARGIAAGAAVAPGSTDDVALSLPGKVPWTDIDQPTAKVACENRRINGVSCHLMTMREWATVCFLIKLLGHDIRGNNSNGRDYRDPNSWEYFGVPDPTRSGRVLTGTGPISWSHNGMANGIFDIVGNVSEWIDFIMTDSVYRHIKKAQVHDADGVTAGDAAIVIDHIEELANWPSSGLALIKAEGDNTDEYIRYSNIVDNGDGSATLTGVLRGQEGTEASAHANDAEVQQLADYCLVPGGAKGVLVDAVSAADTEIAVTGVILGPGGTPLAVGDTLQAGIEQMQITADLGGGVYSVTRGANGSTAVDRDAGSPIVKLSTQMSNTTPSSTDASYGAYQTRRVTTLRQEADLVGMAIPFTASSATNEYKDYFSGRWTGTRAARRGGYWDSTASAQSGFYLDLGHLPSHRSNAVGFRAALSL
jgi:hypothetical protein